MTWKAIWIPLAAGVAVVIATATGVSNRIDLPVRDAMLRSLPRHAARDVAAVVIDEESIETIGPWPWTRQALGSMVTLIHGAGARGVVVDLLLPDPRAGDFVFAQAIAEIPTVLIAAPGSGSWILPSSALGGVAIIAHGALELDGDGVLRRVISTKQAGGVALPSVGVAAATLAEPDRAIPVGRELVPAFRARPPEVPSISAIDLLRGSAGDRLRGKVVFLGVTAAGLGDRVVTPVTLRGALDPGVAVHAAVTEAILRGDLLTRIPPIVAGLAALFLGVGVELVSRKGGVIRLAGLAVIVMIPAVTGFVFLSKGKIEIPIATLVIVAGGSALIVEARAGYRVHRQVGAAVVALGGRSTGGLSLAPEERMRQLERIAGDLAYAKEDDAESRRVLAHELKTPVTSIRGLTQLLTEYDLTKAEAGRVAKMVAEESTRLQSMIDGLLDLERVRGCEPRSERVDLFQLVEDRISPIRGASGRTIEIQGGEKAVVDGDPALLERIVDNLVTNALKFSPESSAVRVRVGREDATASIEVEDAGPGVPAAERAAIFRRFGRGKNASGVAGLGLGLAMVAEIASRHGGNVDVRSAEPGGSIFRVVLPLAGRRIREEAV